MSRLFKTVASTDRLSGRTGSRHSPKGKSKGTTRDAARAAASKLTSRKRDATFYQYANDGTDDEDFFGYLAGMAEEDYESGEEEIADAMVACQSAKRRLADVEK